MPNVLLYIDDNKIEDSQSLIDVINGYGLLSIIYQRPSEWKSINETVMNHFKEIDGIIIDWKLSEFVDDIDFKTEAFIQELRTKMANELETSKYIPIILCSANPDFTKKYLHDNSSHDLFDLVVDKHRLNDLSMNTTISSLADGYKKLSETKDIQTLLGINDLAFLDVRFVDILSNKLDTKSRSDVVQFILHHLIKRPGMLIDEQLLAVRLGINIEQSEDWGKLIDYLREWEIYYQGIFSTGYQRAWMPLFLAKWKEKTGKSLRSLDATSKVEIIHTWGFDKITSLSLQALCMSKKYWVICNSSNEAIDTVDGLLVATENSLFPWEDQTYISPLAAVQGLGKKVAKTDEFKLENYKTIYNKTHVRDRK
jgi:hypothetical protein